MRVNCLAFGSNDGWLASGGADNSIRIWDTASGRELRTLNGHTGWVNALAVSLNDELLASGSNDLTVRIWQVKSGEPLRILNGHTKPIEALVFGPDGRLLASGSADGTIKIWDITSGMETQSFTVTAVWSRRWPSVLMGNCLLRAAPTVR